MSVFLCLFVCVYVCVCVHVFVCVFVFVCVCVCVEIACKTRRPRVEGIELKRNYCIFVCVLTLSPLMVPHYTPGLCSYIQCSYFFFSLDLSLEDDEVKLLEGKKTG